MKSTWVLGSAPLYLLVALPGGRGRRCLLPPCSPAAGREESLTGLCAPSRPGRIPPASEWTPGVTGPVTAIQTGTQPRGQGRGREGGPGLRAGWGRVEGWGQDENPSPVPHVATEHVKCRQSAMK